MRAYISLKRLFSSETYTLKMSSWIALITVCLFSQRMTRATTDPELLEQLWNQLYRFLPGISVSPQLPSELAISVDVAVSLDNVELIRLHNTQACRASLTILAEWPVTDARVADSRLVELMNGGVRLDVNRVWHPELIVHGSYRVQKLSQRLELRAASKTSDSNMKSPKVSPSLGRSNLASKTHSLGSPRIQSNFAQRETTTDDITNQAARTLNRASKFQITSGSEGPRYVYVESLVVEVTCNRPRLLSHVAVALCPILIRQGGLMHVQPNIKWTERKSCLVSDNVQRRISHVTLTKLFGQYIDQQGADNSLGINICFSQTTRLLQCCLLPIVIVTTSLVILWTGPVGAPVVSWLQLTLLLAVAGLWIWLSEQDVALNGRLGLLDIWIMFCLLATGMSSLLAIVEHHWLARVLKQRQCRFTKTPSVSLLQTKTNLVPGTSALNVNPGPGIGCFQGFTGAGSPTTCHENCVKCTGIQGCANGSFISPTGTNGVYCSNSSCGASGHVCSGLVNHVSTNSASNSPAPMGFTSQQIVIGETKMDAYRDGFLCVSNSDSSNVAPNSTIHGLRWRGLTTATRRNNNAADLSTLEIPDCHACLCSAPANQVKTHPGSPAPPYTSVCSSMSSTIQTSFCLTGLKIALTASLILIATIFWIAVLAVGTVPEACLGASLCQPISTDGFS